ncbi:Protein of unknown function (DUF2634) [Desulfitobacterium dehalogenans ATCC 51507]|uniref:DUF2634 domain-containing protein n=1 Tax=Desulfitobacterium dehalogenans (strain ATCC 51507 / DSM 9161 / JW/IU-DC1) TaxID=756499 RepID=I4A6E9_DESDJ|nr:DUF2634 domain-containing protein [Desulfitobacterium dehalogenans]AFL99533.1 Protein of unknown function (DUF2634) [Desulfitobacterium dehalogenans ATCC 51507]
MIPTGGSIANETIEYIEQPSLTWKLDPTKERISGRLDGLESVKQSVSKILQTQRFRHLIYTPNYGAELDKLIGMNPVFVKSEATRMLQEALTQDDRITGVEDVRTTTTGDNLLVEFTVISTYGNLEMSQEVSG